jgi:hypothetical protein
MVDVTFPFIILLGGLIVGMVTVRVRGHRGHRVAADILAAAICGPLSTWAWMRTVPHLLAGENGAPSELSPARAYALADLLWFSPVIGGFVGVTAVAIGYRLAGGGPTRPQESSGEKIGAFLRIVGWVYAIIAALLATAIVILAISYGQPDFISVALIPDLLKGAALILAGWGLARLYRTPKARATSSQ